MIFPLGQIVQTPGVRDLDKASEVIACIKRHAEGDWGELDRHDTKANNEAVIQGTRLLSAYVLSDKTKIWIITEADRSATTVLLPDEY